MNLEEMFEKFEEMDHEFLEFKRIENPPHSRPDLCAFVLLDKLVPGRAGSDIVGAAEHDEIWLDVDCEKLADVVTEADILALVRCGVRFDEENESLAMFV